MALFCAVICAVLLVAPEAYLRAFDEPVTEGTTWVARRAGPIVGGLAIILWSVRALSPGPARRGIATGIALAWAGVFVTTLQALPGGAVPRPFVIALLVEGVIVATFTTLALRR